MVAELTPAWLRCEYLVDPLGIDVAHPRLSWMLESSRRAQRQSAYQVLVAESRERLTASEGDLWDSGKVPSDQSAHIVYAGDALRSGQRCWWAVRVWDGEDNASAYSAPAWWEMGLLCPEDWQGRWIGLGPGAIDGRSDVRAAGPAERNGETPRLLSPPSPYLRRSFTLAETPVRARLYVTARGLYEIALNGKRVGDALLAPGWTDYRSRIQYQTYDVGHLLHAGENALGAVLSGGWYSGHLGFAARDKHYGDQPQALLQLRIAYADGATEVVVSDGAWRGTTGPILSSDLLMGEEYDARRALPGWDMPGYDDSGWAPVSVADRDAVLLVADRAEPIRIIADITPRVVTRRDADIHIVDMGQNMVGWVRLRVRGAAGMRVRLRFAEILQPDGAIYTENLRAARATDTYALSGRGEETFEPRFTFHGFRYVEVTGYPGDLAPDALIGRMVSSDTPLAGTFACSNEMVNQLQRNIVWGQRGNFLSIPTDCPQRDERLGWLADAQIFARTACCNADAAAFFTKWLTDVADAQAPDGAFPDVAPLVDLGDVIDLSHGAPAWGDAGVIVPWTLYQVYGDTRIIERHYDGMARWLSYIGAANPDYLWVNEHRNNFGDWLALDGDAVENPGASGTPKDLLATAYYAYDARLMAHMAQAIGRVDDADRYDALFRAIKAAFVGAYVSDNGQIAGDTQTGYVLALHMDLLPVHLRAVAARRLVENIERHGWHLTTGFVGVGYLCPVLTEAGYADVTYRLLLNDTFPSWGYSIRHGATTIWERWDGWTDERGFQDPGMNSFNHYSLGSVGEWLYRYVAGIDIDPEHPGYKHILIRPQSDGGLTHAKASYQSIHGMIASEWRVKDGAFTLEVDIPANTTATVHIVAADPIGVTESGRTVDDAPGVAFVRMESGHAVLAVQSGTYAFTSGLAARP